MKKTVSLLVALVFVMGLFSCARTEESGVDFTMDALEKAETVTAYVYGEKDEKGKEVEKSYEVEVTDELVLLTEGEWTEASGRDGGNKLFTITVGTQHEITFFDNGRAMIYYGYASIFEKDRAYYSVSLEEDVEMLCDWCVANGTLLETEE